ncbi:tRNA uracil-5-methyltransferase, tRNA-modifying enzyme [Pseudoloma neurophilia]|uniref:tRNA uracil-5-methyltransferase, tRNA-modifying enzyme n=1 Tax=Pseudoloma neurophilia TaxID=146866 RepID=A0A0R0M4U7_9MICR|nr:tRNA uracil-5-methyltransferase, tRNA-modifying enzyme [Pseudoloma neurophilia]
MFGISIYKVPKYASYKLMNDLIKDKFSLKKSDFKMVHHAKNKKVKVFFKEQAINQIETFLEQNFTPSIKTNQASEDHESQKGQKLKENEPNSNTENLEQNATKESKIPQKLVDLCQKLSEYLLAHPFMMKKVTLQVEVFLEEPKETEKKNTDCKETVKDIRDIATPLWKMQYPEQLEFKKRKLDNFLKKKGLPKSSEIIPFDFDGNLQRNSFEFAIGFDSRNRGCLGFRGVSFEQNPNLVFDPSECGFITEDMKKIIQKIQDTLQNQKDLIYNRETKKGNFRMIKVRVNTENEYLVIVDSKSPDKELSSNLKDGEAHDKLTKTTRNVQDQYSFYDQLPFENILYTHNDGDFEGFSSRETKKYKGQSFITQKINEYTFRLSAFGFFQCNIYILKKIIEKIQASFNTDNKYLIDLCCGQMTLGILLSKSFKGVIGIENNPQSIIDFNECQKINKVQNCKILEEDVNKISIHDILSKSGMEAGTENKKISTTFTAILDPPRAGVHKDLIKKIRKSEEITELFYISCAYDKAITNITDLLREPSNAYGQAFHLVETTSYDMFVGTGGVEVLFHFRR